VGLFNAWQLSGQEKYLQSLLHNWMFIKQYIRDRKNGEWFWGIHNDHTVMQGQDKAAFWKCPYHNGRTCLEIIHRLLNQESLA
jgi:cellobiose epimerase